LPEIGRRWIAGPPEWLEVRMPTMKPDAALIAAELDAGEFDAILLAEELGASELILDDMDGRKEAERRHSIWLAPSVSCRLRRDADC
jgi:predicted nucleic acid-binding protein